MRWIGLIWCVVMLAGCHRTPPQRPTFHGQDQRDTTAVQLLTMNQKMADEADLQLARLATEGYALMEDNYWVKGLTTDSSEVHWQAEEYISLQADFYDLDGHLLTTHQADVQLGKVDEIRAIVLVLPHVGRNKAISMLVPWYLAFGSAGNQVVPPYENIRVELNVK